MGSKFSSNPRPASPETTPRLAPETTPASTESIAVGVPVATTAPAPAAAATAAPTQAAATAAPTQAKKLDLCFTMDCTGSMGAYIAAAKQGITRITQRLAQAEGYDLRYGLVAYRDHPPQDSSYVTKSFPFTTSLETMQGSLASLSAQGGGDGPEAVAAALKATYEAGWREDATKVVVLIADAPPHGLGESGDGFPNGGPDGVDPLVVLDQMSAKGITIYSVGCQPALSQYRFATEFFVAVAERTNGQAVALGSAAALADVILGASVEEMDLEALTAEVQQMAVQMRAAQPALADDVIEQQVFQNLQAKGTKTRKVGGSRLQSAHAGLVSAAPSLACAKASLAEKGPPPRAPQGLAAFRKSKSAARRRSPTSPMSRSVDEDDLLEGLDEMMDLADEPRYRGSFGAGPPPPSGPPGMMMAMPARACAAAPPQPGRPDCEERVALEEDAISMAQVSRLYARGKKKGIW